MCLPPCRAAVTDVELAAPNHAAADAGTRVMTRAGSKPLAEPAQYSPTAAQSRRCPDRQGSSDPPGRSPGRGCIEGHIGGLDDHARLIAHQAGQAHARRLDLGEGQLAPWPPAGTAWPADGSALQRHALIHRAGRLVQNLTALIYQSGHQVVPPTSIPIYIVYRSPSSMSF